MLLLLVLLLLLLLLLLLRLSPQVYSFKGGHLKPKNERFNSTAHPYELVFDEKAIILEIQGAPDIPLMSYAVSLLLPSPCCSRLLAAAIGVFLLMLL